MTIKNHKIVLKDTSPGEMARFRYFFLNIWRQQIEGDKNTAEIEKFAAKYTNNTTRLGQITIKNDLYDAQYINNTNKSDSIYVENQNNIEDPKLGDYFDLNGTYMGSDNLHNKLIYIIKNNNPLEMEYSYFNTPLNYYNKNGTINKEIRKKNSIEITKLPFELRKNIARGILNHYYKEAGYNLNELKAKTITDNPESGMALSRYGGVTPGSDHLKPGEIDISVTYGEVGSSLQNGYDIINLFSHERGQHVEDLKKLGKEIYNTRFEYNAYMKQVQEKSWKNTSQAYKDYIEQVAGKYVHYSELKKYFKK
ncbi:hypothetical protein [Flavobacterium sp. N502540]|uniref:hypothetical protein n=1 Tax=Flavobacterium sp. N502540 TaxID=2986838 RepID=UPI0022240CD8|nr:hypothetical protein [Flavobacterium sp. N502540]